MGHPVQCTISNLHVAGRPQHCQPGNNHPPEPPVCLGIRLPRLNCLPSRAGRLPRPRPRASLRRRAAGTNPRPSWTTTTTSPAAGKTQNGTSTAACNKLYNRFTSQSTKACCKSKLSLFCWEYLCQTLFASDLASAISDIMEAASCCFAETLTSFAFCSLYKPNIYYEMLSTFAFLQ